MNDSSGAAGGRPIQVAAATYRRKYFSLVRTITHWYQAHEVANVAEAGGGVLEIGPGAGHTSWLLRNFGLDVTTLDYDGNLKPDLVGDVTNLPCADNAYDVILCAEVLEHIPFTEFQKALKELSRVARRYVVLTLPAPFAGVSSLINISGFRVLGFHLGVPYWVKHHFDGEHYWEIGKRGYSLRSVKEAIQASGFEIVRAYRPPPSLYAYFFVLKVSG